MAANLSRRQVASAGDEVMTRPIRLVTFLVAALSLFGCSSVPDLDRSALVFRDPATYVGKQVRVCGFMVTPSNLQESDDDLRGPGLSLDGPVIAATGWKRGDRLRTCLSGVVFKAGCETGVCVDWAYEYGLSVKIAAAK